MARASIVLDADLLAELVAATGARTKTDAVRDAVHERLRAMRLTRIRAAAGTIDLSGVEEQRHEDSRLG